MVARNKKGRCWPVILTFFITVMRATQGTDSPGCENGLTLPDGVCDCYTCWEGETCAQYASNPPKFPYHQDTATITEEHVSGKPFYTALATDEDAAKCKDPADCPCGTVTYFIMSQDGESAVQIDTATGQLSLVPGAGPLQPVFEVTIGASDDGVKYDTLVLTVRAEPAWDDGMVNKFLVQMDNGYADHRDNSYMDIQHLAQQGEGPLSRHKRSITLPSNVTFDLVKEGVFQSQDTVGVGHRIQFKLDILFPAGDTDIQVELFAPDGDIVVMMLCNVQVTVGSNLVVSGSSTPSLESLDNTIYNDRAIIPLGQVSNSGSDLTSVTHSTITVTYEAVMLDHTSTQNGQEYWVSVGAEFNNENDVWVGQAKLTADTTDTGPTFTPEFNLSGPDSLPVGGSGLYTFEMTLPFVKKNVQFDVFAPINATDALSICGVQVVNISEAFACSMREPWEYVATGYADGNTEGFGRMHFDLGDPINKLVRENTVDSKIYIQMVVSVKGDQSLAGGSYWLGGSAQLGFDTIWAGQIQVAVVASDAAATTNPTFSYDFVGDTEISDTQPVVLQLNVSIPPDTSAEYTLEVLAPSQNSEPIYQVCSISLAGVGTNMPCGNPDNLKTEYFVTSNTSAFTDRAVATLGRISNVGPWGHQHGDSVTSGGELTFNILLKATDHAAATVGSSHEVLLGMFVGNAKLTIGQKAIVVGASSAPANITGENTPSWDLRYNTASDTALIGSTVKTLLEVTTAPDTIYSPFTVEFIMPNNSGEAMLKICKVELESVGKNTPCLVPEGVKKRVEYISSFDDGVHDRAVLAAGSLCNSQQKNDTAEDKFVLAVSVMVQDHAQFSVDPKTWISTGVMYSAYNLWVGQIALNIDTTGNLPPVLTVPHIAVVSNNGNMTSMLPGYPAKYYIRLKMAPNDTSHLALAISTTSDTVSLCSLRIVRLGTAYPCADLQHVKPELLNVDSNLGLTREAHVDLGNMANVGPDTMVANDEYDENTIELEVMAKLTTNPALVPDGSTHTFTLKLDYDTTSGSPKTASATVTMTITTDTTLAQSLTLASSNTTDSSFSVVSITGVDTAHPNEDLTKIVKTESKRMVMDISTVLNSTTQLTVKVLTPSDPGLENILDITYIGLMEAGNNMPCLKHQMTEQTYEPRTPGGPNTDIATLDLSYVCNTGVDNVNVTANTVRVEAVVRLLDTTTVSPGDTFTLHAAVNSNDQEISVYPLTLTVADVDLYTDVYADNVTVENGSAVTPNVTSSPPVSMNIAEKKTVNVLFQVPGCTSSKVWLDSAMPVNTSAIMTVEDVQISSSGRNLGDLTKYDSEFTDTKTSTLDTSQINKWEKNLGVVSNPCVTRHTDDYKSDDDIISADITIQMADHELAQNGEIFYASFGLHVARFIFILDLAVTVVRTGSEQLEFNMTSSRDDVNSTSDRVEIDTMLSLSDTATAEGRDTVLLLFLPPYVSHVSTVITSPHKTIVSESLEGNVLTVNMGPLYFTDEVHLTTTVQANATYFVPIGVTGLDSVMASQAVANTLTDTDVCNDIDYLNFTISTTPTAGTGCTPGPLGMASGVIQNCQISSSHYSLSGKGPTKGRLNDVTGWSPFVHNGQVRKERYFQVYFGHKMLVSKVQLQQTGAAKVTAMAVGHSNDGVAWVKYPENVMSPDPSLSDETLDIPSPQVARYIRLYITDQDNNGRAASLRFEFIGCQSSTDGPSGPCQAADPVPIGDFKMRSFLVAAGTVYVCDGTQGDKGIQQRCYSSTDGRTWMDLDSRVGAMVGYESDEPRVYAVSADGMHYMTSADGVVWETGVPDDVTEAKAKATFSSALEVPVDGNPDLDGTPKPAFTQANYAATSVGLKNFNSVTWDNVFNWSTCCP